MSTTILSPAAIASNRFNARKSTGPRTPRGKAIAAANALRHGLFARDLLLAGESADELLALKTALIQRLNPRDLLELELAERVIAASWKLRRLQRFERLIYQRQSDQFAQQGYEQREAFGLGHREPIPAEVAWQSGGEAFQQQLDRIENHQHRLENALHRSLRQLEKLHQQEIDESPGGFAEEALATERLQHEKWRNEAGEAGELFKAAQLSDAQDKRQRLQFDREVEAAELCDDGSGLTPKQQMRAYLFPDENRRNEAGDPKDSAAANERAEPFHPQPAYGKHSRALQEDAAGERAASSAIRDL